MKTPKSLQDKAGQAGTADGQATRSQSPLAPKGAKGGTASDNRHDLTSAESDADRYTVAMTAAATDWLSAHPAAYRRMVDGTMGEYRGQPGEFALRMAGLMRACADAAGFPCFRVWLDRTEPRKSA